MDFDAVYSDPQTVHSVPSWSSLPYLDQGLLPALSASTHSSAPTAIQATLLCTELRETFLTVLTAHQNAGKTLALCLFAATQARRSSEARPAVLFITPDEMRARYVKAIFDALDVRVTTTPPAAGRPEHSILIHPIARQHMSSRFSSNKDGNLGDVEWVLIDDAEDSLSSKEWRNTIGAIVLGFAIERRSTKRVSTLFTHRAWQERTRKFLDELTDNIRTKWNRQPETRELVSDLSTFPSRTRYFSLIGPPSDLIPCLFMQDQIVFPPPVLFLTRSETYAESIRSRLCALDLRVDVMDCSRNEQAADEKVTNFSLGQLRYLLAFPELPRKYQTIRPNTLVVVGLGASEEMTLEELGCMRRFQREGTVVIVSMREDDALWVSNQLRVRVEGLSV